LDGRGEELPSFIALFRRGQLRWTIVGIICSATALTAYYCYAILPPKALVDHRRWLCRHLKPRASVLRDLAQQ
jgi:hypothetical protein